MSKNKLIRQGTLYQFLVAIVFGLIGFGLNFLDIELLKQSEFKISILVGLLFPMIIAHAWGWRYGLLSALAGGCQSMWWLWHTDGYGLLYAVPIFTIWVIWHGYWADYRQNTDQPRWFHSAFIIEIPFRVVSELGFYTIFRWLVSLNPPPWAPSITWDYVSLNWINTVAVKHIITSYILLLIIHMLLRFTLVRRFFGLKKLTLEQTISRIYASALLFGALLWFIDGVVDYLFFNTSGQTIWETTVLDVSSHNLFMRYMYFLISISAGVFIARLFTEREQSKKEVELLLDLSREASTETSLDDLLFFIVNQIVEVIPPAEAASIFLYDERRKVVRVQAWAGFNDSEIEGLEFSVNDSHIGKVFLTRKPTLVNDVSKTPGFKMLDKPSLSKVKSVIITPLISKNHVIGTISVDNLTKTGAFSQKNLDLLESIGNQLAGVIKNANLLDQVRESEALYQSVVGDSPGIINRFLPDGMLTFINQEGCGFFGKTFDELIGTNIQASIPEEDRENVMLQIASLTKESPVQVNENKKIRYDGEIRLMRWTNRAIFDKKGKVISCQSFGEDITESKQAEEKLKISEERFRAFMEHVPAFAYILDKDLRHIYGNPASVAADGYSTLERYIGTSIQNNYPDEISDEIEANSKKVLNEGCITKHEFSAVMQDGKTHTLLDIKFPIQLPGGNTQVGGLSIDVTEMKAAQKAVHEEQEKSKKYLDIAGVLMLVLNKKGEITLINQKGCQILGYQENELIGLNWVDTCLPKRYRKEVKGVFKKTMAGWDESVEFHENPVLTKSGEEKIIAWHNTVLWDEKGHNIGVLSSGEDITERKHDEIALLESQRSLETLMGNLPGMAYRCKNDAHWTMLFVSQGCFALTGYEPEDLLNNQKISYSDLIYPDDRNSVRKSIESAFNTKSSFEISYRILTSKSKEKWVWEKGIGIYSADGEQITIEGFIIDITDQITSETELHKKSESVALLYEAGKKLGQTLELKTIYENVYSIISQTMPCDQFIISSFDPHDGLIHCEYVKYEGREFDVSEIPPIPLGVQDRGTQSYVILSGESLYLADYVAHRKTFQTSYFVDEEEVRKHGEMPDDEQTSRSALIVPLKQENQVIGVIQVFSYQKDNFSEDGLRFLEAFSPQVAAAITNAALYKQTEQAKNDLQKTVRGTIHTIAATVEARDPYTAGHQGRVADLATAIAQKMHLPDEQVEGIKMAGVVHDLGKINIPAEILSKPGKLSELEFSLIKTHPLNGFDLLKKIEFPWPIAEMVLQHHEKMDGSGYPQGLKGDDILLEARILAVADIVEAMSSHRPYRPALGIEKALAQIKKEKGTLLDPGVVDACLKIFKEGYKLIED